MKIEKYNPSGDPEKMKRARERAKAIEEGRLPQWEAEQAALTQNTQSILEKKVETPESREERMRKLREGDPEKLAAKRAELNSKYPKNNLDKGSM